MDQKKRLELWLKKVNWSLRHRGCEHYSLHDPSGKISNLVFYANRIELNHKQEQISLDFNLECCEFEQLDNECISLKVKNNHEIFINFYNY